MRAHVTIQMETLDSDEDFKQPSPMQVAFALHRVWVKDKLMDVLRRERAKGRKELHGNGTRGANTWMVGARTRVGRELRRLNQRHAGRWVELCCECSKLEGGMEKRGGGGWRKLVGFGEKRGGGWRKLVGFGEKSGWRKLVGFGECW